MFKIQVPMIFVFFGLLVSASSEQIVVPVGLLNRRKRRNLARRTQC